jgi:hypothetical protein
MELIQSSSFSILIVFNYGTLIFLPGIQSGSIRSFSHLSKASCMLRGCYRNTVFKNQVTVNYCMGYLC